MSITIVRYLCMLISVLLIGCTNSSNPNATGSGVPSTEERSITAVRSVELYGVGTLTVDAGGEPKLTIEADDNMLQYVKSSVDGETLRVGVGAGTYVWNTGYPRISMQSSNVSSYGLRDQTQLVLNQADLDSLTLSLDGQCSVSLTGKIGELTIAVSGQCSIDASGASIGSIAGKMNGQSTLICSETTEVKVEKNSDSIIKTSAPD